MDKHWILVAHRAGARIFEQVGMKLEVHPVHTFENSDGRLKTSELVSDRQGRSDHSKMKGHSALGDSDGPRAHVLETFVDELGEYLEQQAQHNSFTSLTLVAEPHMLGVLRKAIGILSSQRLRDSLGKDLVHISDHDMAGHLKEALGLPATARAN